MRARQLMVLAIAIVMAAPAVALAQDEGPPPITWVNSLQVTATGYQTLQQQFETYDKPVLEKLLADGVIISWGFGSQMVGPADTDYVMWATMPGWSSVTKIEQAFHESRASMSEQDMKSMMEGWSAAVKDGSSRTQIIRHLVAESSHDAGEPKYLLLAAYTAKPGMGEDASKMYKSFVAPVYDSLLADGTIIGYGLAVPDLHTGAGFTHEGWVEFSDTAAIDAIDAAFMADDEATSAGDKVARDAAFKALFEADGHHDRLINILASNHR